MMVTLRQQNERTQQQLLTEQTLRVELAQRVETLNKEKERMQTEMKKIENKLIEVWMQLNLFPPCSFM